MGRKAAGLERTVSGPARENLVPMPGRWDLAVSAAVRIPGSGVFGTPEPVAQATISSTTAARAQSTHAFPHMSTPPTRPQQLASSIARLMCARMTHGNVQDRLAAKDGDRKNQNTTLKSNQIKDHETYAQERVVVRTNLVSLPRVGSCTLGYRLDRGCP
jgi:hypothetical protein